MDFSFRKSRHIKFWKLKSIDLQIAKFEILQYKYQLLQSSVFFIIRLIGLKEYNWPKLISFMPEGGL